jgi:transcriptional regulator with XRE-family HTH domain
MNKQILIEAAYECMSPEQLDVFEILMNSGDLGERFGRCVSKRISPTVAADAAAPVGWFQLKPEFGSDRIGIRWNGDVCLKDGQAIYAVPIAVEAALLSKSAEHAEYKSSADCPYIDASDDVSSAWSNGWNQCLQAQLRLHSQIESAQSTRKIGFSAERFYAAINAVREQRGLTWQQVTKLSDMTSMQWTRLAQGRIPDPDVRVQMAIWANLHVDDYFDSPLSNETPLTREEYEAEKTRAAAPQAVATGHEIGEAFLKWSEWTTELGEAISRTNIDGFVGELRATIAARKAEIERSGGKS